MENVYMILQHIYSRNCVQNFTTIAGIFYSGYYKKIFGLFFPDTLYIPTIFSSGVFIWHR